MLKTLSFTMMSVALLTVAACMPTATTPSSDTGSSSSGAMAQSSIFLEQNGVSSDDGVVLQIGGSSSVAMTEASSATTNSASDATRTIQIQVSSFAFTPNVITAKKGEKVRVQLVGVSGIHGFAVPGLGINVRVEAGKAVTIDLPTDQAGSFDAFCSIPCGPGHEGMKATVVIQ